MEQSVFPRDRPLSLSNELHSILPFFFNQTDKTQNQTAFYTEGSLKNAFESAATEMAHM